MNDHAITTLRAAFVAPMDRPMIRDGGVVIDVSRIADVGKFSDVVRSGEKVRDLGDVVLLPGLVNAHAHLELSSMTCEPRGGASFVDWLNGVRQRNPHAVGDAVREGIRQCQKFGVTAVGDITQQVVETRSVLGETPFHPTVVSYAEVLGLGKRRARFDETFKQAFACSIEFEALSPHSPYTVDRAGYEKCLATAKDLEIPLATHLAESPHEREFLEHHTGPFRELWERLGSWDDSVETFRGSPIEFAHAIGMLDYPTSLAHVNYCDNDELALLSRGRASVVYCPRTHKYFDHPPHRWREMLAAGVNVGIGTDSCASSPDLNLLDDMRLLHKIAPEVLPETIWQMGTIRGAKAIQLDHLCGSITPQRYADLICFEVKTHNPLREILENDMLPRWAPMV